MIRRFLRWLWHGQHDDGARFAAIARRYEVEQCKRGEDA